MPGLDREAARSDVRSLMAWNPLATDGKLLEAAWMVQDRYQISCWDALIVAAAQTAGRNRLLTEDLQDGQIFDGAQVVNPFSCKVPK